MATIKAFECIKPTKELAKEVAALPYDVYNREEACEAVKGKKYSFLRIDRAETQFDSSVDTYDDRVYAKAKELLDDMINEGVYVKENKKCYYIYELTMDGRTQTGIVACASIDDYLNNVINEFKLRHIFSYFTLDFIVIRCWISSYCKPFFLSVYCNFAWHLHSASKKQCASSR